MKLFFIILMNIIIFSAVADIYDDIPASVNDKEFKQAIIKKNFIIGRIITDIHIFNKLVVRPPSEESLSQTRLIAQDINSLIEPLDHSGLLDIFPIQDWLTACKDEGTVLVASLYLQKYPQSDINSRL